MALGRREPEYTCRADPARHHVNEPGRITQRSLTGKDGAKVFRVERFGMRRKQPELFQA